MSKHETKTPEGKRVCSADVSLWCENGHDPKIPDKMDGKRVCSKCGTEFEVDVSIEVDHGGF